MNLRNLRFISFLLILFTNTVVLGQTVTELELNSNSYLYTATNTPTTYSYASENTIFVAGVVSGTDKPFLENTGNTTVISETQIDLLPGFEVVQGSIFNGYIAKGLFEFYEMKNEPSESFVVIPNTGKSLRFLYKETNKIGELLTINIYDDLHQKTNNLTYTVSESGDNVIKYDVSTLTSGFYLLELINEKKEKWYLKFKKL
jgi:hypothetical protein